MTLENVEKTGVPPLSYSSMNEILSCEQKYAYRKILELPSDEDYTQETDALDLGSVFHTCLELCKHDLNGFRYPQLLEEIRAYDSLNTDVHGPLLWAMLRRYKNLHESVGLNPLYIELELIDKKEYRGFVDLVLEDKEKGGIWITDMKTAGYTSKFLHSRLSRDPQLNLYVHYYKKVIKSEQPILGCRYRVVTKTKLKRKTNETMKAYSERIYKSIQASEYVIPIDKMNPAQIVEGTFKPARVRQKALHKNATPIKNYQHCESYRRPCEFWSRCHGKQFSEDFGIEDFRF